MDNVVPPSAAIGMMVIMPTPLESHTGGIALEFCGQVRWDPIVGEFVLSLLRSPDQLGAQISQLCRRGKFLKVGVRPDRESPRPIFVFPGTTEHGNKDLFRSRVGSNRAQNLESVAGRK